MTGNGNRERISFSAMLRTLFQWLSNSVKSWRSKIVQLWNLGSNWKYERRRKWWWRKSVELWFKFIRIRVRRRKSWFKTVKGSLSILKAWTAYVMSWCIHLKTKLSLSKSRSIWCRRSTKSSEVSLKLTKWKRGQPAANLRMICPMWAWLWLCNLSLKRRILIRICCRLEGSTALAAWLGIMTLPLSLSSITNF